MNCVRMIVVISTVGIGLLAGGSRPSSASESGGKVSAIQIVMHMQAALGKQKRIEVRGSTTGTGTTAYLFRFQSPDRESIQETGGSLAAIQIGKRRSGLYRMISIGRTLYRTLDGSTWFRASRSASPRAEDATGLNGDNRPCCAHPGKTGGTGVRLLGAGIWRSRPVYTVAFSYATVEKFVNGRIIIDRATYLPLQYTVSSKPPATSGVFTTSYGGSFDIHPPR